MGNLPIRMPSYWMRSVGLMIGYWSLGAAFILTRTSSERISGNLQVGVAGQRSINGRPSHRHRQTVPHQKKTALVNINLGARLTRALNDRLGELVEVAPAEGRAESQVVSPDVKRGLVSRSESGSTWSK